MNPPVEPFGQFKLVHEVAVGGMGEILLASDTQLSRPVAIKRVLEKFRTRPDVARMFEVEATIMSVLRHPNIVRVFESGEIEGVFYISMEYIHGKTLRQLVDRSREVGEALPPALVIEAVSKLARALSYAHGMTGRSGSPMGLVHRDVNPSNLLLGYDGSVKLIDFGIVQTDDELAPEDLEPKGKFAYMSPEQTRGERVDRRSDLFSLGICLYEALTLYNPFIHESKGGNAVEAIQSREPSPVSERNHRLSPFDPILSKLLAKNPDERFQDGADLADALDELGGSFKSFMPLAAFMTDLFESQKAQEDAMLETV
ncbi:MAG: serine/threonine-protein kinase, partial [Myxococcota bacterium]